MIDATFLDCPWYGSRQMARHLKRIGHDVGRRRAQRLMAKMGLTPIYQRPRTSDPHPQHQVYPYLLRELAITRPNQVWCADVTYIPMRRGSCIWSPSWTGQLARFWLGGCPTPWMPASALLPWRKHWPAKAGHRSEQPIYSAAFTSVLRDAGGTDQYGWARALDGQCLHQTAVAVSQVRMRLSACLRNRIGASHWPCSMDHILQHLEATLGLGRANPGGGVRADRAIR